MPNRTPVLFAPAKLLSRHNVNSIINSPLLCAALLLISMPLFAIDKITLSTGMDYSSGDYAATSSTEIWYIPFSIKFEQSKLVYRLTIPYIRITGPGNVTGVEAAPTGASNNSRTSESGIGDIIAGVSYNLLPYQAKQVLLDVTAKIKIPVADESRGLGSGELDFYIQADAFYHLNQINYFATIGYKIYGDPPGINYRDSIYLSVGSSYSFIKKLSAGIIYDFREAAFAGNSNPSELTFFASKRLSAKKSLLAYIVKGLSKGSPEWGIGISFSHAL